MILVVIENRTAWDMFSEHGSLPASVGLFVPWKKTKGFGKGPHNGVSTNQGP